MQTKNFLLSRMDEAIEGLLYRQGHYEYPDIHGHFKHSVEFTIETAGGSELVLTFLDHMEINLFFQQTWGVYDGDVDKVVPVVSLAYRFPHDWYHSKLVSGVSHIGRNANGELIVILSRFMSENNRTTYPFDVVRINKKIGDEIQREITEQMIWRSSEPLKLEAAFGGGQAFQIRDINNLVVTVLKRSENWREDGQ